MKTVFVDSSVLFTAVNSPTGGSAKLFTVSQLRLITSKFVLTEVERNVRKKLLHYHLERFFLLAGRITVAYISIDQKALMKAKKAIVEKDAVILCQAKLSKSNYLVTLDKKHFFTKEAASFIKPAKIVTSKKLCELYR